MEFLCERGAEVNRGLRSSSLHYAACFGRPQIVKVTVFLVGCYIGYVLYIGVMSNSSLSLLLCGCIGFLVIVNHL